jgi:hypothetical protein
MPVVAYYDNLSDKVDCSNDTDANKQLDKSLLPVLCEADDEVREQTDDCDYDDNAQENVAPVDSVAN